MDQKKIVVPEEGYKAAESSVFQTWGADYIRSVASAVHAFVRWQSENPTMPTDEQLAHLSRYAANYGCDVSLKAAAVVVAEWQRRMYLAPEPEVPEEVFIPVNHPYSSDLPLSICRECFALVHDESIKEHRQWHEYLERGKAAR